MIHVIKRLLRLDMFRQNLFVFTVNGRNCEQVREASDIYFYIMV